VGDHRQGARRQALPPVRRKVAETDAAAYGKELGVGFVADLVTSHELAILSLQHDGLSFTWKGPDQEHLERIALAVDGALDLMRAGHLAPRGMAKLLVAALDSYAGASPELDEVIAHKDDLMTIIDGYSGDGKFKAEVKKDAKTRTITVRASGKKLSDVVPVAFLVPAVVAGFLFSEEEAAPAKKPATTTKTHLQPLHISH